jgi:soluble lytic murein transglycosylase-like protein
MNPRALMLMGAGLVLVAVAWPSKVQAPPLPALSRFQRPELIPLARAKARKHGVPEDGLVKQMWVESRFNPSAVGPETRLWGRAKGIAQFIDATAAQYNIDPFDPDQALDAAARYMASLHQRYVDKGHEDVAWSLAAAGYNWGPGNVDKFLEGTRRAPDETKSYVAQVHEFYGESNPLA